MNNRYLLSLIAAPLMVAALSMPAFADATNCKDGTTSEVSGRGACSGHGGVLKVKKTKAEKKAEKAAKAAEAPAAPAAAAPAAATATAAAPAAKATVTKTAPATASTKAPTAAADASDPAGATAKCKDGTFSHSKHHSGTCSRHGGVGEWLTAK